MKIKPAKYLIGWTLRKTGFWGVTLPWAIYILPEHVDNQWLIRHELKHAEQIKRIGVVTFYAKYLYQVLKYGYRNAPLEVEAREAEKPYY